MYILYQIEYIVWHAIEAMKKVTAPVRANWALAYSVERENEGTFDRNFELGFIRWNLAHLISGEGPWYDYNPGSPGGTPTYEVNEHIKKAYRTKFWQ